MKIKTTVRAGLASAATATIKLPRPGCGTGGIVRPVLTTAVQLA